MDTLSPARKLYYSYLSTVYAAAHWLRHHSFLGIRLSSWLVLILLILLIVGWVRNWSDTLLIVLAVVLAWLAYSLWSSRRANYTRFVPDEAPIMAKGQLDPLPTGDKVDLLASGRFSVTSRESDLLLRPGKFWRVPLGDQIVMVEDRPGHFLYQFFDAESLQSIERGWLLFGRDVRLSLAVNFLARWGPEYTKFQVYEDGKGPAKPPKPVTIYLTFSDDATRQAVWHTVVSEARRVREGGQTV